MNLWVKRTGQLFIAILFLMSCEDDSFLLGFQNKNKKFNVRYQGFTLPSSVILIDTVTTDNLDGTTRLLVGQYEDAQFGTVRTELFTQIFPSSITKLDATAVYDSITLQVRLDFYSYGAEGVSEEKFTIHEITEDSLSFYNRYYYNSTLGYSPTVLAEAKCNVDYEDLQDNVNLGSNGDTILFRAKLLDSFGLRLFNLALNDPDSTFSKREEFSYLIKGLAFIPSQSNMVIGINTASLSYVAVHYHTTTEDSLRRTFPIGISNGAIGFNHISTNRTGDLAGVTQTYEGYVPPSGLRYLQNGSPVITKFDIRQFYDFITGSLDGINDSLKNIVINSAEISIDVETPPAGTPPPTSLTCKIMNVDDLFLNSAIDADSAAMAGFYVGNSLNNQIFQKHYFPGGDLQPAVTLTYLEDEQRYSGFITLFMQDLFDRKAEETRIRYLGLVPINPVPGKSVDRAVISNNGIKLKINYTSPKVTNQ